MDAVVEEGPHHLVVTWQVPVQASFHRTDGSDRMLLLPGTMALEHLVQAGEALIFRGRGRPAEDGVPVLGRVRSAKFREMIRPGEVIRSTVRLVEQLGPVFEVHGVVHVGAKKAVEAKLAFTAAAVPQAE